MKPEEVADAVIENVDYTGLDLQGAIDEDDLKIRISQAIRKLLAELVADITTKLGQTIADDVNEIIAKKYL